MECRTSLGEIYGRSYVSWKCRLRAVISVEGLGSLENQLRVRQRQLHTIMVLQAVCMKGSSGHRAPGVFFPRGFPLGTKIEAPNKPQGLQGCNNNNNNNPNDGVDAAF